MPSEQLQFADYDSVGMGDGAKCQIILARALRVIFLVNKSLSPSSHRPRRIAIAFRRLRSHRSRRQILGSDPAVLCSSGLFCLTAGLLSLYWQAIIKYQEGSNELPNLAT